MRSGSVVIRGELFLTLEAVANCYRVEARWMHEVYELGLLGAGEPAEESVAIPARKLDRVAEILKLHFHQGVNLEGIALLIGFDEDDS